MSDITPTCSPPEGFDTESVWFRIVCVIVLALVLGLLIANAIYWNRFRQRAGTTSIPTKQEADGLFWFNAIMAFIVGAFFLWSLIRLFVYGNKRKDYLESINNSTYMILPDQKRIL